MKPHEKKVVKKVVKFLEALNGIFQSLQRLDEEYMSFHEEYVAHIKEEGMSFHEKYMALMEETKRLADSGDLHGALEVMKKSSKLLEDNTMDHLISAMERINKEIMDAHPLTKN